MRRDFPPLFFAHSGERVFLATDFLPMIADVYPLGVLRCRASLLRPAAETVRPKQSLDRVNANDGKWGVNRHFDR
jgi:hypothetical protein